MGKETYVGRKRMNLETGSLRKRVGIGFILTVMVITILYSSFGWYSIQLYRRHQETFNQDVIGQKPRLVQRRGVLYFGRLTGDSDGG